MKLIELSLPEYSVSSEPNDQAIGKVVDGELKKHFMGKSVLVRGVAFSEHLGKTLDELVEIIKKTGTDRYDPKRAGDRYENIEGKHIDLFAFPVTISPKSELSYQLFWGFYHGAKAIHGYPMRIDIITIYDATQMERVLHQYEDRDDIKDDGFAFKYPGKKSAAILGIIKIT